MANGKKIPRQRLYQHFITLPEQKRKELLRKHFTAEAIEDIGKRCYTDTMMGLANAMIQGITQLAQHYGDAFKKVVQERTASEIAPEVLEDHVGAAIRTVSK